MNWMPGTQRVPGVIGAPMTPLGTLGGEWSIAYSVNNDQAFTRTSATTVPSSRVIFSARVSRVAVP